MQIILVRGASGVTAWTRQLIGARSWQWVCSRDSFSVTGPDAASEVEPAAAAIIQHSAALVGAVSQVVQLDL